MRNTVSHYLKEAGVSYITGGTGNTNSPLYQAGRLSEKASIVV